MNNQEQQNNKNKTTTATTTKNGNRKINVQDYDEQEDELTEKAWKKESREGSITSRRRIRTDKQTNKQTNQEQQER